MEHNPINFISSYFSSSFIEAVENFEEIIYTFLRDSTMNVNAFSKIHGTESITIQKLNEKLPMLEKSNALQFILLRVTHLTQVSFFLAVQSLTSKKYFCLMIVSTQILSQKWKLQTRLNSRIFVKQLSIRKQTHFTVRFGYTRIQDIIIQPMSQWSDTTQELKAKGNQYFSHKIFFTALLFYEYALASSEYYTESLTRSILYANASACFYEMRLYDRAIQYADLAIRIEPTYAKGYFRKINALLEKKKFEDIPDLLMVYSQKVDTQNFNFANTKYTNYLANYLGILNWSQILYMKNQQSSFCDYISSKIQLISMGEEDFFCAKQTIQPSEIILLKKPLYYAKNTAPMEENKVGRQIQLYISLEEAFYNSITKLSQGKTTAKSILKNHTGKSKFAKYFLVAQQIQKYKSDQIKGYGIWPQAFNFQHSCEANCSYMHVKGALFVSSAKTIPKGALLSLDFAAYEPNRQKYLKQKYNFQCNCQSCSWNQQSKDFFSLFQTHTYLQDLEKTLLLKQTLWIFLREDRSKFLNCFGSQLTYKSVMQKFIEIVSIEAHWVDILRLLQFYRVEKDVFIKQILQVCILDNFVKFLKVNASICPCLIDGVI